MVVQSNPMVPSAAGGAPVSVVVGAPEAIAITLDKTAQPAPPADGAAGQHWLLQAVPAPIFALSLLFAIVFTGLVVGLPVGFLVKNMVTNTAVQVVNVTSTVTQTVTTVVVQPFWPAEPAEDPSIIAPWSYDVAAPEGPTGWGNILNQTSGTVAYPLCKSTPTSRQTPVDLPLPLSPALRPLSYTYNDSTVYQIAQRPGGHPGFQVRLHSMSRCRSG